MSKTLPAATTNHQGRLRCKRRSSVLLPRFSDDCWCVLRDNTLYCYKNGKLDKQCGTEIDMNDVQTIRSSGDSKFEIVTSNKKIYEFNTSSSEEKTKWMKALNSSKMRRNCRSVVAENDPNRSGAGDILPISPTTSPWSSDTKSPTPVFDEETTSNKFPSMLRDDVCKSLPNLSDSDDNSSLSETMEPSSVDLPPNEPELTSLNTSAKEKSKNSDEPQEQRESGYISRTDPFECSSTDVPFHQANLEDKKMSSDEKKPEVVVERQKNVGLSSKPSVKPAILTPKPKLTGSCSKPPRADLASADTKKESNQEDEDRVLFRRANDVKEKSSDYINGGDVVEGPVLEIDVSLPEESCYDVPKVINPPNFSSRKSIAQLRESLAQVNVVGGLASNDNLQQQQERNGKSGMMLLKEFLSKLTVNELCEEDTVLTERF